MRSTKGNTHRHSSAIHQEEEDYADEFSANKDGTSTFKDGKGNDRVNAIRSNHSVTEQRRRCEINQRLSIPLILSAPATVLSLTANDQLKVTVNTVLGSSAPPLTVKILKATDSSSKSAIIKYKDFLGLVEKLYYLSGKYDIELSVGDAVMENSFLWPVGHFDLELPKAPEKATRPPPSPADPSYRFGPKAEITHIFRSPGKRPSNNLSLVFLGLVLPLMGFLTGTSCLLQLVQPFSGTPAISDILFHVGIAAVLGLFHVGTLLP